MSSCLGNMHISARQSEEMEEMIIMNRKIQSPLFFLIISFLTLLSFVAIKRMDEIVSQHPLKKISMSFRLFPFFCTSNHFAVQHIQSKRGHYKSLLAVHLFFQLRPLPFCFLLFLLCFLKCKIIEIIL